MVNAFFILGQAAQHIGSPGTDGEGKSDLSFFYLGTNVNMMNENAGILVFYQFHVQNCIMRPVK